MTIVHSIILGIIEGVTEFLPISSTAHLDIARALMGITQSDFLKTFEIGIQAGAILAVLVLYGKKLFSSGKYFMNIAIAFVPTGIIGFILYKLVKMFLLGNVTLAAVMLLVGGIVIVLFERKETRKLIEKGTEPERAVESLTVRELLTLGIAQALAVIPGVSRSGAVIVAGRMLGIPKGSITEFSFVLAIPTILGATAYDLLKTNLAFSVSEWQTFAIGFIVAMIVAFIVIKWLLSYIRSHSFAVFGWYRIVFGLFVLVYFLV